MILQDYLKKYDLTQRALADKFGITISHLRPLLSGERSPSKKLATKIELITEGEVTKYEALFMEDYKKGDDE